MTVIPWVDGNILTAGSLRVVPQFYDTNFIAGTSYATTSGTNFSSNSVGSIFVSGGLFAEKLIVSVNAQHLLSNANFTTDFRIFTSGAGLGGGSQITASVAQTGGASTPRLFPQNYVVIGSNQGWIPGSDCYVYFQAKTNVADTLYYYGMNLFGTGKP